MTMVGAASRELVEVMAPFVRWIGEEGTKASPDENRAARASVSVERRTMILSY